MKRPYVDDSEMTEIIIQPDGRIYAFGLTVEVAEVLRKLDTKCQIPPSGDAGESGIVIQTAVYNEPGGVHGEG